MRIVAPSLSSPLHLNPQPARHQLTRQPEYKRPIAIEPGTGAGGLVHEKMRALAREPTQQMAPTKSDREAGQPPKKQAPSRAEARQQRLAAQLRENLKKRKAFARARKTLDDDSI